MKWRVLVVDDEPVILAGIKRFIIESGCGCEVVGEANDGEEAIAKIEKLKPHIVVSDIQMPKATGIDMIRRFYSGKDCPKFIFVSGYNEFEYVKDAIRYDAVDYLLKPVSKSSMESVLQKSIRQLTNENTLNIFKEEKTEIQVFFEKIYQNNEFAESEMYDRFQELGLDCSGKFMVSVCFGIDFLQEDIPISYEQKELLRFVVYNELYDYYRQDKRGFIVKKDDIGCYFILMIPDEFSRKFRRSHVESIKEKIESRHRVKLRIGIGERVESIGRLQHAFKTAKFAQELYFFDEEYLIDYQDIHQNFDRSFEDYEKNVRTVCESMILDRNEILSKVENVLDIIFCLHYGNRYVTINRCAVFLEEICICLKEYHLFMDEIQALKNVAVQQITDASVYREVRECILQFFNKLLSVIEGNDGLNSRKEIAKVKSYIKQHYKEDISLNMLANLVGMNVAYFSVFFQKNAGENYKAYLTRIRMEEAHKLLLGTDMLTYEIAEQVGYNTVRRFTEAFKKAYGANPMEYKKERTEQN